MCVAQLVRCKTSCCQKQLWPRRWLCVENEVTGGICPHHCQGWCAQHVSTWVTGHLEQPTAPGAVWMGSDDSSKRCPRDMYIKQPELVCSPHCPGSQHPSACPPLSSPDRFTPRKQQPRGFARHGGCQGMAFLLFLILFQAQLQPLSLVLRLWKELFETKFLNNALWADVIPNLPANTACSLCRI